MGRADTTGGMRQSGRASLRSGGKKRTEGTQDALGSSTPREQTSTQPCLRGLFAPGPAFFSCPIRRLRGEEGPLGAGPFWACGSGSGARRGEGGAGLREEDPGGGSRIQASSYPAQAPRRARQGQRRRLLQGTGTALTVRDLRPFTPPQPRGGWPRRVLRLRPRWTLSPGHNFERTLSEDSTGQRPGKSKVGGP